MVHPTPRIRQESPPDHRPAAGAGADVAGEHHRQRLADGAACLAAGLHLRREHGLATLALCPPDHAGIGLINPKHARDCRHWGKAPFLRWLDYQDRLPTAREVEHWWRLMPTANLGCTLGPVSGLVRVDADGAEAQGRLLSLSGGDLPPTWEFRSGRRDGTGRGILYAIPPGVVFQTTPQPLPDGELRFQAKGAQTVLPPSRHKDGGLYEWLPGRSPDEVPLAPAPRWAVERWREKPGGHFRPRPIGRGGVGCAGVNPAVLFLALVALDRLSVQRATDYDLWIRCGMALHSVSADLLPEWDAWSARCREKYQEGACAYHWGSFGRRRGWRLRHLINWAHADSGWTPGGES
jgi:hypothetical protein